MFFLAVPSHSDAMLLSAHPSANGSTVLFLVGSVTHQVFCHVLLRDSAHSAGLPYHSLKGNSFRIGAAAGLPDWLIKVLGRWSTDWTLPNLYSHSRISATLGCSHNGPCFGSFSLGLVCLGGCMPCMHLWRLSLRSDFPQALGIACVLPSCTLALILSDPARAVLGR